MARTGSGRRLLPGTDRETTPPVRTGADREATPPGGTGADRETTPPVGTGAANGSFGELLQGALPCGAGGPDDDGRFLVTLPLDRWSLATFRVGEPGSGLRVEPAGRAKAARLAGMLLAEAGTGPDGVLRIDSGIPEGKGLAGSSADLVATARAIGAAVGHRFPPERLGPLLAAVEPTDGVMHPGIVAYAHHRGALLRSLGQLPALRIVAVDQGGRVDTVAFGRGAPPHDQAARDVYARLLDDLATAVASGDLATVGRIATTSAVLNQDRLPKRNLAALVDICDDVGGLGLVACHSGTMLGVLLDPRASGHRSRLSRCVRLARCLPGTVEVHRTLSG